jgi:hypothetical protein
LAWWGLWEDGVAIAAGLRWRNKVSASIAALQHTQQNTPFWQALPAVKGKSA